MQAMADWIKPESYLPIDQEDLRRREFLAWCESGRPAFTVRRLTRDLK